MRGYIQTHETDKSAAIDTYNDVQWSRTVVFKCRVHKGKTINWVINFKAEKILSNCYFRMYDWQWSSFMYTIILYYCKYHKIEIKLTKYCITCIINIITGHVSISNYR